jgi:glucose/arabinose dehydrogenase
MPVPVLRACSIVVGLFMLQPPLAAEDRPYGVPPAYEGALDSLAAINIRNVELQTLREDLAEPWAFEFLGPDEVLVSETRGRLLRVPLAADRPVIEISGLPPIAIAQQQTGLLDVALHPQFELNHRIYFSYAEADAATGRYYRTQVATARLVGNALEDLRPLLADAPFGWSPSNFGGALEFDGQGRLLITIGDRSEEVLAQRGDRLEGKILRLSDDGAVPPDNPFVGDPEIDDRIIALGVRNAQGLVRDPETDAVYFAEHGPLGGDEVNRLTPGANYGWPTISYGLAFSTAAVAEGTHAPGMIQPLFYYLPSEAISPLAIYRGAMFPEWRGDLLVGALKGRHVSRLDLDGEVVRSEYPILGEIEARIRDLKIGPDGALHVLTEDGRLLRLVRTEADAPATRSPDGERVYRLVCAGCHDSGAADAPRLDDACAWQTIAAKGWDEVWRNTRDGINAMPERGLCHVCTDAHLEAAARYLLAQGERCAQGEQ